MSVDYNVFWNIKRTNLDQIIKKKKYVSDIKLFSLIIDMYSYKAIKKNYDESVLMESLSYLDKAILYQMSRSIINY